MVLSCINFFALSLNLVRLAVIDYLKSRLKGETSIVPFDIKNQNLNMDSRQQPQNEAPTYNVLKVIG